MSIFWGIYCWGWSVNYSQILKLEYPPHPNAMSFSTFLWFIIIVQLGSFAVWSIVSSWRQFLPSRTSYFHFDVFYSPLHTPLRHTFQTSPARLSHFHTFQFPPQCATPKSNKQKPPVSFVKLFHRVKKLTLPDNANGASFCQFAWWGNDMLGNGPGVDEKECGESLLYLAFLREFSWGGSDSNPCCFLWAPGEKKNICSGSFETASFWPACRSTIPGFALLSLKWHRLKRWRYRSGRKID